MKMRAPLGDPAYWAEWVAFGEESIALGWETASKPFGDPSYAPQYLFELAQDHWHQMLRRYSAGLPTPSLASYFPGLLDAWERSQALGAQQWTEDQVFTRNAWRVNYDHYITCFWVVALALVLEIPDEQWQRLIRLVGNEGEDSLLDRVIATRSPQRCIGGELLYPKPYGRLQAAIDAERPQQASLLRDFVDHWYLELGNGARSGKYKQAAAFKHPYWYRYGDENFAGGAYFGRWCVEAAAAVKVFGLDDQLCLGHEHYPQALLHEQADLPAPPVTEREKRGFWARLLGK
ncbi:PoNe immunity protein domain-containing protein [Pseudomonas monteilii]|uniref:PoNe immunity protein domain-containing protein n=1 Tax=Pseudomonas monteilii TaxID=76759 RepID=UPI001CBEE381|nr:PoNe immunity protein domain-containing protein [Pseudomonas monteilii]MBZ3664818.1 DUF1911 domain-containing protein [Pseudomonas monteilii]MBZ3670163.1 DUF1911 domain-containing protein [Pseudomonas monteilii]